MKDYIKYTAIFAVYNTINKNSLVTSFYTDSGWGQRDNVVKLFNKLTRTNKQLPIKKYKPLLQPY